MTSLRTLLAAALMIATGCGTESPDSAPVDSLGAVVLDGKGDQSILARPITLEPGASHVVRFTVTGDVAVRLVPRDDQSAPTVLDLVDRRGDAQITASEIAADGFVEATGDAFAFHDFELTLRNVSEDFSTDAVLLIERPVVQDCARSAGSGHTVVAQCTVVLDGREHGEATRMYEWADVCLTTSKARDFFDDEWGDEQVYDEVSLIGSLGYVTDRDDKVVQQPVHNAMSKNIDLRDDGISASDGRWYRTETGQNRVAEYTVEWEADRSELTFTSRSRRQWGWTWTTDTALRLECEPAR